MKRRADRCTLCGGPLISAVDNHGDTYKGCGSCAIKTLAQIAAEGFEHPEHHSDECPGDCVSCAMAARINGTIRLDTTTPRRATGGGL